MADYALACPRCQKGMWDQKNGQFPWKPGTPIAKCKDKECAKAGGVYWEDSKALTAPLAPVPVTATRNQPQPTATYTPKSAVPVDKDVGDYYAILTAVLVHHAAFTKEAPLAGPQAEDIANTATFSDLRTIATTISIARNGGRG